MRSVIETGRPIVIIVKTPTGQGARFIGHIESIPREFGGVAHEVVVIGQARPLPEGEQ